MEEAGKELGPYTLIREIGRGSFGVVWLAEKRTSIVTTRFALKLQRGADVDLYALRREASIWVQASGHPNVLPLIEADVYDGEAVLVSEYAPDGSLEGWLSRHGGKAASVEAACEVVNGILAGLAHLHDLRIIHRDLKPENVLLQRGIPRLTDFGISRVLRSTSPTVHVAGTFAYMAPEAFDGVRNERTDLWAVGVILYRLLSGRLPYPQRDTASLMGAIVHRDPPPLRDVPRALHDVVARAMRRDPAQRYASAASMRADLLDAVHGLWLGRHTRELGAASPAVKQPEPRPPTGPARTATIAHAAGHAASPPSRSVTAAAVNPGAPGGAKRPPGRGLRRTTGVRRAGALLLLGALVLAGMTVAASKRRPWNTRHSPDSAGGPAYVLLDSLRDEGPGMISEMAFSPDGKLLAVARDKAVTRLWDVQSRSVVATLPADGRVYRSIRFSADGRWLLTAAFTPRPALEPTDYATQIWDVRTGRLKQSFGDANVFSLPGAAFSPDGRTLALATHAVVELRDVETGEWRGTLVGHRGDVHSIAFAPDGATLASGSADSTVMLWDVRARRPLSRLSKHGKDVWDVVFSPDGSSLASASGDGTVKLWNVALRALEGTLRGHTRGVDVVMYAPGGRYLLSVSQEEHTGILWAAPGGQRKSFLTDINWTPLAFSPDGKFLAGSSSGGTTLWEVQTGMIRQRLNESGSFAFSPDGVLMAAAASYSGKVRLWRRN